jgi:hypothetical protein
MGFKERNMNLQITPERLLRRSDLAVIHIEDKDVLLLAEVTWRTDAEKRLPALASHANLLQAPYAMLVDPSRIRLYEVDGREDLDQPAVVLNTEEVIRAYDPEIDKDWLSERYLSSLIMSWLYDLIERWEHAAPPGDEQLTAAGLDRDRWRRYVVYSGKVGDTGELG